MNPFYSLGMFPYPSGVAHLGHVRVYTVSDVAARHARLHDQDVLHPMGWDAFGLPAENAALKHGVDPEDWTTRNIEDMRHTFRRMGWSFDWDREISTADPDYYRWTQWLFVKLFERGLAYQADGWVHFCDACGTVLADEQVIDGACWRCEQVVTRQQRRQWMFRTTAFAERLWAGLDRLTEWDPRAIAIQRQWIRRSPGAWATFGEIEVFTTRIDTLPGVVAVVVAPEHPWAQSCAAPKVRAYVKRTQGQSAVARHRSKAASGVALGRTVPHPLSGEAIPVYVGDYVIGDHGTGAVMCVPAHDPRDADFAEARGLPAGSGELRPADGVLADLIARETGGERVAWNLRDWSVGRQRRWGCPIPIVYCERCGTVAVEELPVPLDAPATLPCPRCGEMAPRETDTLDTFVCSSWYAFRFTDPHNAEAPFERSVADRFFPIGQYVGGLDHAAQHMLYFRFMTKFLHDLGMISVDEPVSRFVCNGMVLDAQGRKMSKSLNNGVDPSEAMDQWGSDAVRLAILADMPVDRDVAWDSARAKAKARFLRKWATAIDEIVAEHPSRPQGAAPTAVSTLITHLNRALATGALHVAVARVHELARVLKGSPHPAGVRDCLIAISPLVPQWVAERWPSSWGDVAPWPAS